MCRFYGGVPYRYVLRRKEDTMNSQCWEFMIRSWSKSKFLTIVSLSIFAYSRTMVPTPPDRGLQIKIHDVNQVEMCVSNYGKFGQNEDSKSGCWWPKGSRENYIYGAGTWFGTIDRTTGDTLVTVGYNPNNAYSEYRTGLAGMSFSDPYSILFFYPADWPAPLAVYPMAPQDPFSHQDSWCAYNDLDVIYHEPNDTRPIGLEVYQSVYVWNLSTTQDIIFVRYELKNVSGDTLKNCYFGVCADNDIGNEEPNFKNDRTAGIAGRWYVINGESLWVDNLGYQWQDETEAYWNEFPGTIGYDFLQSPWDLPPMPGIADKDNDGIDDYYERDSVWFWENHKPPDPLYDADMDGTPDWRDPSQIPQLGMTALNRYTLITDPKNDAERYMALAGFNHLTGSYEPFDTLPSDPDDWRIIQCSGPFELLPDSTAIVLVGIVFAKWHDFYGSPDSALAEVDNTAQFIYDMNWLLPGPPPPPQLTIIPGDVKVTLTWNSAPEITPDPYYDVVNDSGTLFDPFYREYDFEGYRIWKSLTGQTGDWHLLAFYDLYNDILFEDTTVAESIRIRAENTGIVHSYVDEDVRNGFTYYYAVTSFDYNFVEEEGSPKLLVFESGLSGKGTSPRRDAWNYVGPGEPQFDVIHGNERLLDIVDARG
jgi:hypothetical protein